MRYTRLSLGVVCLAAVSACKTDLTELNTNPNSPTTAPAATLFTQASVSSLGTWSGVGVNNSMTELFAQHVAQIQYIDEIAATSATPRLMACLRGSMPARWKTTGR